MAEPTAHTEAPAGRSAFPPFQKEHFSSQILWLTVSFVLLYVLMSKIALPRIGSILAARSKLIGDDLVAAERLKEQSDAAHAAYEKALAEARARAQSIASSTRQRHASEAEATQKRLERRHGQCAGHRGGHRRGDCRTPDRQGAGHPGCVGSARRRQELRRRCLNP
jgi:F-type H+-transporting ATPase subunit b